MKLIIIVCIIFISCCYNKVILSFLIQKFSKLHSLHSKSDSLDNFDSLENHDHDHDHLKENDELYEFHKIPHKKRHETTHTEYKDFKEEDYEKVDMGYHSDYTPIEERR